MMNGGSQIDSMRTAKLLSMKGIPQHSYQTVENRLGKALNKVSKISISEGLKEEIKQTTETYHTEKYGTLPALAVLVDMAWQKRAAGRSYNSPSGVLHTIGGKTGKIIHSFIYHNKCSVCALQEEMVRRLESLHKIEDREKSSK